jgi:GT2 family glycosyltransferase
MPTYNREQHVLEAIESVLAQTWSDYELFVIDDGSTDGTQSALAKYGSRVQVIRQLNEGPEVARNNAAAQARGDYLVFLDSDDLLFPQALEAYAHIVESCDAPPLIIGSMTYFADGDSPGLDEQGGSEIRALKFADYLSRDVTIGLSNSRIVIRKSLFEELGGLRQSSPSTFHLDDFNLILKVATKGPCVVLMDPKTVAYRVHGTNSIRDPRAMVNGILSIIDAERRGEYPGGKDRRWDRYACIGGISQLWVVRTLQAKKPGQALRVFLKSTPMLAAAMIRKVRLMFREKTPTIVINKAMKLRME